MTHDDDTDDGPDPVYRVQFWGYCGMGGNAIYHDTRESARTTVARRLRAYRERARDGDTGPVVVLERGKRWEVESREDAVMISDDEGTLHLDTVDATAARGRRLW